MKYDELRRLAIRLAKSDGPDSDGLMHCRECKGTYQPWTTKMRHTSDCPIAELEAEEDAPEKSDAQRRFEFVAKGIELGIFDGRDMGDEYKAQLVAKPAGKYEGEY